MKVEKMKKELKERWLEAIDTLINYYAKSDLDTIPDSYANPSRHCPLCVVSRSLTQHGWVGSKKICTVCPWTLFAGHPCMDRDENGWVYCNYPAGDRIARLIRWKELITGDSNWGKLLKREVK